MNLEILRSFCRVVDLGGFTAAARSLHLAQPVVSNHVRILEEHFATRLLDRLARPVVPTQAGARLYEVAQGMWNLWTDAENEIRPQTVTGSVIVGSSYTIAMYMLPPLLGRAKHQHPGLQLRMVLVPGQKMGEAVLSHLVDFGISEHVADHPRLRFTPLFEDEQVLVAAPDHPAAQRGTLTIGDLTAYRYFLWEKGTGARALIDAALAQAGVGELPITLEVSAEGIKQGVIGGLGLGFSSRLSIRHELSSGAIRVIPVEGLHIRRTHYVIVRESTLPRAVEAVVAIVRQQMPALVAEYTGPN